MEEDSVSSSGSGVGMVRAGIAGRVEVGTGGRVVRFTEDIDEVLERSSSRDRGNGGGGTLLATGSTEQLSAPWRSDLI